MSDVCVPLVVAAWLLGGFAAASAGCDTRQKTRSELFEEAETHYRQGEYEAALDDYQAFRRQYPRSRLAETAKLRIETVNREVQGLMDRDDMPAPDYVGSEGTKAGEEAGSFDASEPSTASPSDEASQ